MPFRDAYHITGSVVNLAEQKDMDISQLNIDDLQEIDERIGKNVIRLLDNRASMNARNSQGGTATKETKKQIRSMKKWIRLNKKR